MNIDRPWLVAGDFNDIAYANEKKGGNRVSTCKCSIFRDNMEACNLYDLGAMGPRFTWRGPIYQGGQRIFERLDRVISNERWRLLYTDAQVKVLTRFDFLDHHPIMVTLNYRNQERVPKPFRFESAWMLESNYMDRLKGYWNDKAEFVQNLKKIEDDAQDWKICSLNHVQQVKRGIAFRLRGIQKNIHDRRNIAGLMRLEKKLHEDLKIILRQEELM
ncbi:uncharacterized protein LOC131649818 [Vicia villosa]|uniref:uncharacterized protein LOC131649818 n=1 Tax=Vicia villosa TaxID=3911 RepID=UPI00273B2485|nr:uncharacterized protein LOC131649818 [Vicia villosa]